jgi:hypothetical protein
MRIAGNGSIGIGRTDPTNTLDVTGTVRFSSTLSAGATTVTSLDAGSGAISTTGTLSGGSTTVTSLAAGSGAISTTGNLVSGSGSASAPSHTFSANTTVGMFSPATNSVALTTASTERMRILANGNVGIGTTAPSVLFDVSGAMRTTTLSATSASITDVSLNTINGSKYSSSSLGAGTFRLNYAGPLTSTVSVFAGSATQSLLNLENGPPGTGKLFNATAITIDLSGNLYITDKNNTTVRKVTPSGVLSTFAESSNLRGLCADDSGNVFVLQANSILRITPAGAISAFVGQASAGYGDGSGTSIFFNNPQGIAVDSAGNLYVTEITGNRVRKISSSGVASTLAGSTAASAGTSGTTDGAGTNARFNGPSGITVDSTGTVYVADQGNSRIRKITSDGTVTTFAGQATNGSTNGTGTNATFSSVLQGLAVDSQGIVYVADNGNGLIRSITPSGVVSTFSSTAGSRWVATQRTTTGSVYVIDFVASYSVKRIITTRDATYASTTLTGTLETDFDTQLASSFVTVPASTTNARIAKFTLTSRVPTTFTLSGDWALNLCATVGLNTSPATFYFQILDGSTALFTTSTVTSVNLSTPLQTYVSTVTIPSQTTISNLVIDLFATTQASSPLIIGFNGLNASYLKTAILPYENTVLANDYEYRLAGGRLKIAALMILAFSLNSTTNASTPIPYTTISSVIPNSANTGNGGFWLAPRCRFTVFSSGVTSLDIINNGDVWQYFSNDLTAIATRTYQLFLV